MSFEISIIHSCQQCSKEIVNLEEVFKEIDNMVYICSQDCFDKLQLIENEKLRQLDVLFCKKDFKGLTKEAERQKKHVIFCLDPRIGLRFKLINKSIFAA